MVNSEHNLPEPPNYCEENVFVIDEIVPDSDTDDDEGAYGGYDLLELSSPDVFGASDASGDEDYEECLSETSRDAVIRDEIATCSAEKDDEQDDSPTPVPSVSGQRLSSRLSDVSLCSDISMDGDKIDEVKQAMRNVTLPLSSYPEWAKNMEGDGWMQNLLDFIASRKKDK